MHSAAIHLLRRLRKQDVATGVGAARLSALSVLVFGGPQSLRSLARAEQVKPPTMSRIVEALEAEGLAQRSRDKKDGRAIRLRATAKGVRVLQAGRQRRIEYFSGMLQKLGEKELATIARAAELLEKVVRA